MVRLRLRTRIFVAAVLIVLAIATAILVLVQNQVKTATATAVSRANDRTNQLLHDVFQSKERQLEQVTTLLADRPGTRGVYVANTETINDHLSELVRLCDANWMALTDQDGRILGFSEEGSFHVDDDVSRTFRFSESSSKKPWRGMTTVAGSLVIAARCPIIVGEYVQAWLISAVRIDNEFAQQVADSSQIQLALFERGRTVAATLPGIHGLSPTPGVHRLTKGRETWIGSFSKLPGTDSDIRFLALVPERSVTAPFEDMRQRILIMMGIAVLIAAGLSLMFATNLSKPLEGLIGAARQVQNGQWPEPFNTSREDEIGLLQTVFDDMTLSLQAGREKLLAMLVVDPLTELWNHRSLRERLDTILSNDEGALVLAIVGLDHFESYNRSHSSHRGDQVLLEVAQVVREHAGDRLCGRHGGDQFAIVLPSDGCEEAAEALRLDISRKCAVTVSIGFAMTDDRTRRSDLLFLAAEMALRQAKERGRDRVCGFETFRFSGAEADLQNFLQQGSYPAVRALAEAVDAKDEYTRGHSQRVAEYARDLARVCGYDEGFVELVYTTGTLHDVGKIGIPDAVLKKTSRLSDEEFELIKVHPELGEKIVEKIPQLMDTLPGIRSHHERWDGTGYPDQIPGEDIPLLARILAIADTFDAMTSDRPYRKGLSWEIALGEIRASAGTQLDPELAAMFVHLMQEKRMVA